MSTRQNYEIAYRIIRIQITHNSLSVDTLLAGWALYCIPIQVGINALISYEAGI